MRAEAIFFALWCLLAPAVFPGTERSPHELYDAIKALRVDSSNVYRLAPAHHVQLRRGDAVLSFEEGTLTFFSPLDGQITGAVFSGRGHVLAAPREPVEKQQMGRFLGAPVLDQEFSNGYVRFTDDTAGELLRQFRAANLVAQTDASVGTQWDSAVTHLNPSASVRLRAETGTERVLVFQLARALTIDSVTGEHGESLAFFQNEGMNLQERSARGNDYLDVVLPQTPSGRQEFTLHFHYRGNVIQDAGNGVLFVGARESWYPHLGDSAEFSAYDFLLRWPHKLRLIATGSKLEEHEDGEFRVGHWKTEKPMSVAGFNLGEYASASVTSGARSIDVYANRQLEEDLRKRLTLHEADTLSLPSGRFGSASPAHSVVPPAPSPSPADALKQLGKEIDSSIHFYETFSGPFPFHNLSVSQIPGTFGQGWPGLLYVSTLSFLSPEAQQRAGLSPSGQEHFKIGRASCRERV